MGKINHISIRYFLTAEFAKNHLFLNNYFSMLVSNNTRAIVMKSKHRICHTGLRTLEEHWDPLL